MDPLTDRNNLGAGHLRGQPRRKSMPMLTGDVLAFASVTGFATLALSAVVLLVRT